MENSKNLCMVAFKIEADS